MCFGADVGAVEQVLSMEYEYFYIWGVTIKKAHLLMWLVKCVPLFYGDEYDEKMVQSSIILPPFIKYRLCAWQGAKGFAYFIPKVPPL